MLFTLPMSDSLLDLYLSDYIFLTEAPPISYVNSLVMENAISVVLSVPDYSESGTDYN